MRRREFLALSAGAVGTTVWGAKFAMGGQGGGRQLLELRTYHFASAAKQQDYERFLAGAGVPAFSRAGVQPVGVWKMMAKDNPDLKLVDDSTDLWVLLPHDSFESVLTLEQKLGADESYQAAGKEVLRAGKSSPAFTRYESMLLLAFEGFPKVQVPTKSPGRVFELRTYESPNNERGLNKIQMFNSGEFEIFREAGMGSVFYGGAIAGPNLPQLTYMISFDDIGDVQKNWKAFFANAAWKKLSAEAQYQGNVSRVIHHFLRPAEASQI